MCKEAVEDGVRAEYPLGFEECGLVFAEQVEWEARFFRRNHGEDEV
jgi:hypothetical protein